MVSDTWLTLNHCEPILIIYPILIETQTIKAVFSRKPTNFLRMKLNYSDKNFKKKLKLSLC